MAWETNAGAKRYASNDGTEDNSIDFSHSKPNCFEKCLEPQEYIWFWTYSGSSVDFPLFLLGLFYVYVKPFNITQVVVITLNPRLLFIRELILRNETLQLKLCFK